MVWHYPFDLQYWFVNVLAGSMPMFLAIALLVIAALAGMFRMPPIIVGISFALFILLLGITTVGVVYTLGVLIIGTIITFIVRRLIT